MSLVDKTENPLHLKRIHHLELCVGNATQAAYFYRKAFGFSHFAYRGLETGTRESTSYALRQGDATLVLTTPLNSGEPYNEHLSRHGDAVVDIAMEVEDADQSFEEAIRRGAESHQEPHDLKDEHGTVRQASIHSYGDTIHSFISPKHYDGPFLPGFETRAVVEPSLGIGPRLQGGHIVCAQSPVGSWGF